MTVTREVTVNVKKMAYGPRLTAYGPEVKLDTAYGLTNIQSAMKAEAYGIRWSSAVAGDLT